MFDARSIVAAAGEDVVKVYDKTDGHHWDCGSEDPNDASEKPSRSVVERVRLKEGYMIEGRKNGSVQAWSV